MDKIKKSVPHIKSTSLSQNAKDNFTLLKEKYSQFLSRMQKSEMGNSLSRYEKELAILNDLILEAEKIGDKNALDEYSKRAEEVNTQISNMQINILPSYNAGMFYRPELNVVPDVNDGSKTEKIYALSKFFTLDENGEEVPYFTKKEIKEFLKDDKLYNRVLALTTITTEDESGCVFPFFSPYEIKQIANVTSIKDFNTVLERLKYLVSIEQNYSFDEKQRYFANSEYLLLDLVKDDEVYKNACKLLEIKESNKDTGCEIISISPYSLSKYAASTEKTDKILKLTSYRVGDEKKSKPIIDYAFDIYLNDEWYYNNVIKFLGEMQDIDFKNANSLSLILHEKDLLSKCMNLYNLTNSYGERVISDFYVLRQTLDIEHPYKIDLLLALSEIRNEKNERVYSDDDMLDRLRLVSRYYNVEDVYKLSSLLYCDEKGELTPFFKNLESNYFTFEFIQNAEKLAQITFENEDGIQQSALSTDVLEYLLTKTSVRYDKNVEKFFKLIHTVKQENEPIIKEDDVKLCPIIATFDWTEDKIKTIDKLQNLTKNINGYEANIFPRSELLGASAFYYLPENPDENYYKTIKQIAELVTDYELTIGKNDIMPISILELAQKNNFKITDDFKTKFDELLQVKDNNIRFLGTKDAFNAVINGIDVKKIEELSTFRKSYSENKVFNFSDSELSFLVNNPNQIDNAIKLASFYDEQTDVSIFQGNTIVSFLRYNPDFKYDENFEININKILHELNDKNLYRKFYHSNYSSEILNLALNDKKTDTLITALKNFDGDLETAFFVVQETENNEFSLNEKIIERINILRNCYIHNSLQNEYCNILLPINAFSISHNDEVFNNIKKYIDLYSINENGKNILNNDAYQVFGLIKNLKINIDEDFVKKYNELMSINFNGQKFFRESTVVEMIAKDVDWTSVIELAKFKTKKEDSSVTYSFNDYNVDFLVKNPKKLEIAKKIASITYKDKNNEEFSVFDGYKVYLMIDKIPDLNYSPEIENNLKSIVNSIKNDEGFEYTNTYCEKIIEKALSSTETNKFIDLLNKFNGNIEFSFQFEDEIINKGYKCEDIELYSNLSKYKFYDEKSGKYKNLVNFWDVRYLSYHSNKVENVLKLLNKFSSVKNGLFVSQFDIRTLKEIASDSNLVDTILNEIPKRIPANHLASYLSVDFIYASKFLDFQNIENINELSLEKKRELLSTLIKTNVDIFGNETLKKDFPLLPISKEEYCSLLPKLVKSIGIETLPIDEKLKTKFFEYDLVNLAVEVKNIDFDKLEIKQSFKTQDFVSDILNAQKTYNISDKEMKKVFDYFAFEIKDNELIGYPANLQNGKKLSEITDTNTKKFINEVVRNIVVNYTEKNTIITNAGEKVNSLLNDIVKVLPELHTIVSKQQHKTHSYDVFVHSLKVMKEIVNNPEYETLSDKDKQVLLLASLLHDIKKTEGKVDLTHAQESSFDSFFICKKLNLSKEMESKLYDLIKNHDWTEKINHSSDKKKAMEDYAFEFRNSNLLQLANIFTDADLKSVKADGKFFEKYGDDLEEITQNVKTLISELQQTQPLLPNTEFPKASEIKLGKGVYKTLDGTTIIKINEVENFEEIGFPKGTTKQNVKFLVHGLDTATSLVNFNTFSMIDSEALLSTSYLINPYVEYHVFRPQGIILKADTTDVHAGSNMDYGSGLKKDINTLKEEYIFSGANYRGNDRTFFSELVKVAMGTSDSEKSKLNAKFRANPQKSKEILSSEIEKISSEDYIELIEKYQNKSFSQIQQENPDFANELIKIFDIIENCNRSHGRRYNEVLVTRPKIQGVFMFSTNKCIKNPENYVTELEKDSINKELIEFAKENDLPVIMFGD